MNENTTKLDAGNNNSKKYKMKAIYNSAIYRKKLKSGYLLVLYYLIFWKEYLEKKST